MNEILKALSTLIENADENDRDKLAEAIETWAEKFPGSVRTIERKRGTGSRFLDAITVAVDARPGM